MEFIIDNEYFGKAISDVSKAVSSKTPFPILSGIKIVASKKGLILIGSNTDIIIEKKIPFMMNGVEILEVRQSGSVVISAKYLSEIVKKLPNKLHIKVNEKQLATIKSDEVVTQLYGLNADEYPSLPPIDEANNIKIRSGDFIESIKQTTFAVSKSETRPALTGVNMIFKGNHLSWIATDSHRLSIRELEIESNVTRSIVIPSTSLNDISKLVSSESDLINIIVLERYIVFKLNGISFFSRLIDANYPNTSRLLPNDFKTIITLNTKQFLKGIDRACLFASDWKNNNVHLKIQGKEILNISSNASEIGKLEENQPREKIMGEMELSISLDGCFLMDVLKVIKEEEVSLSFGGSMRPVLINPLDNSSFLHLISPVRSN